MLLWYRVVYGRALRVGRGVSFRKGWNVMIAPGAKVDIGENCFFNNYCTIDALSGVSIGNNCLFAESVKLYDNNHRFSGGSDILIREQGAKTEPIVIGDDCWLASNVVVLKGARIGSHCVIGANCVVDGFVPDNSIVRLGNGLDISPIIYRGGVGK